MSEKTDIVERLLTYIPLASYDGVVLAHIAIFKEAIDEITRLRAHAGWHEAIEAAALYAFNNASDVKDAMALRDGIRALLPPGGEKG